MTALHDLDMIRQNHPLPAVAGAVVKLVQSGSEWKACCPFHADRSPSLTIYSGGRRFHCFGCGKGGDVLDFLQTLHGVGLREAVDMLAGGYAPAIAVEPLPANEAGDRLDEARAIWRAAIPAQGTLAETYLRARALTLPIPPTIRFSVLPYGKRGKQYPCLVAAVTGPNNKLSGIQRTYLADNGEGKANVPKAKLSLGRVSGGAIRLAPAAGELVVCEGLEDGLSLQQQFGRAVWVAAGASMLPAMRFPALVQSVVIGADSDQAGRDAARKTGEAFSLRGMQARVIYPLAPHKDFNAELMEGVSA